MEKRGQASRVEAQKKQAFEMQPITSENPRAVQGGLGRRPILKKVGQKLLTNLLGVACFRLCMSRVSLWLIFF